MTTARYYTPSGRCIQEVDYSTQSDVFSSLEDSGDNIFLTDNNREVYGSGGILPDSIVNNSSESHLVRNLLAKGMFFKFATRYFNTSTLEQIKANLKDDLFKKFMDYLKEEEFNYQTDSELLISDLVESVKKEGNNANLLEDIERLNKKFDLVKEKELSKYKDDIIAEINKEIAARFDGRKGRIIESLKNDEQFSTAIKVLENDKVYNKLLGI